MLCVSVCEPCACNRRWVWPSNGVKMKTHNSPNTRVTIRMLICNSRQWKKPSLHISCDCLTPVACYMNSPVTQFADECIDKYFFSRGLNRIDITIDLCPSEPNIVEYIVLRLQFRFDQRRPKLPQPQFAWVPCVYVSM